MTEQNETPDLATDDAEDTKGHRFRDDAEGYRVRDDADDAEGHRFRDDADDTDDTDGHALRS